MSFWNHNLIWLHIADKLTQKSAPSAIVKLLEAHALSGIPCATATSLALACLSYFALWGSVMATDCSNNNPLSHRLTWCRRWVGEIWPVVGRQTLMWWRWEWTFKAMDWTFYQTTCGGTIPYVPHWQEIMRCLLPGSKYQSYLQRLLGSLHSCCKQTAPSVQLWWLSFGCVLLWECDYCCRISLNKPK